MVKETFKYSINDGFQCSEVVVKGEKQYFVEGYISTIDEDKAGEIIDYSAQQDIYKQVVGENITMDIEHEEWYDKNGQILARPSNDKIPVAKIVHAEMKGNGVWVKAKLNTNLRSFPEVWGSIKDGFLKAFSVAFYPLQRMGNVIKSLNLVNVTLTGSPVNPNATFTASMKSAAAYMAAQEMEDKKMSEEIVKQKDVVVKSEEAPVVEPVAEPSPEEDVKEPVAEVKAELESAKAKYDAEIASLKAQLAEAIKTHSDEVVKLKAELEKPVMKSTVQKEVMPESKPNVRALNPLELL